MAKYRNALEYLTATYYSLKILYNDYYKTYCHNDYYKKLKVLIWCSVLQKITIHTYNSMFRLLTAP